jgi:hypothetical protein
VRLNGLIIHGMLFAVSASIAGIPYSPRASRPAPCS